MKKIYRSKIMILLLIAASVVSCSHHDETKSYQEKKVSPSIVAQVENVFLQDMNKQGFTLIKSNSHQGDGQNLSYYFSTSSYDCASVPEARRLIVKVTEDLLHRFKAQHHLVTSSDLVIGISFNKSSKLSAKPHIEIIHLHNGKIHYERLGHHMVEQVSEEPYEEAKKIVGTGKLADIIGA